MIPFIRIPFVPIAPGLLCGTSLSELTCMIHIDLHGPFPDPPREQQTRLSDHPRTVTLLHDRYQGIYQDSKHTDRP